MGRPWGVVRWCIVWWMGKGPRVGSVPFGAVRSRRGWGTAGEGFVWWVASVHRSHRSERAGTCIAAASECITRAWYKYMRGASQVRG